MMWSAYSLFIHPLHVSIKPKLNIKIFQSLFKLCYMLKTKDTM